MSYLVGRTLGQEPETGSANAPRRSEFPTRPRRAKTLSTGTKTVPQEAFVSKPTLSSRASRVFTATVTRSFQILARRHLHGVGRPSVPARERYLVAARFPVKRLFRKIARRGGPPQRGRSRGLARTVARDRALQARAAPGASFRRFRVQDDRRARSFARRPPSASEVAAPRAGSAP